MSQKVQRAAEFGRYSIPEAARYLRVPPATLRSWLIGRDYETAVGIKHFGPLVPIADRKAGLLSFENLVEAHVLAALRKTHGVRIRAIRDAIKYVEKDRGIRRLLLSPELKTSGRELFLDHLGELVNISESGQLAMRAVLESYLERVVWEKQVVRELYPFVGDWSPAAPRSVLINPELAFGKPVVAKRFIATAVIADRYDAGESLTELAEDYGLEPSDIEAAILYERAA